MWLPKDERQLLAGYYAELCEVGESEVYRITDLRPLLACCRWDGKIRKYGDPDETKSDESGDHKKWIKKYFDETNRIKRANKHLAERGLLIVENHQHENDVIVISLTIDGYDLGRKYAHFLARSGLWFAEYQNHWAWLIAAFIGGGFASKLLELAFAYIFPANKSQ
jgi:hypothetical protein